MLNVSPTKGNEYPQQQQSVDLRLPKDCDGQIKMGWNIIAAAFKKRIKDLEDELQIVNAEKTELEGNQGKLVQKVKKLENENMELAMTKSNLRELEYKLDEKNAELEARKDEYSKKEKHFVEENRKLVKHYESLRRKANQLDAFKRLVIETVKKEEDLPEGNSAETSDQRGIGPKTSNSHRMSVGSDFQLQPSGMRERLRERDLDFPSATQNNDTEERRLRRRAQSALSANKFEHFLDTLRKLNSHSIREEEALNEVASICSYENTSLYEEFRGLLSRNNNVC